MIAKRRGPFRLPRRALLLWRVRVTLCALPAPVLVALFFADSSVWRRVLSGVWIAAYLIFFLFFYPVMYRKLSFASNGHSFVVHCGVFYNRIKAMEIRNIQHVTCTASPLEKAMGLCTLFVWGAGGLIRVPSMDAGDARALSGGWGARL